MSVVQIHSSIYRIAAPYEGGVVFLYLLKGDRVALVDAGTCDWPAPHLSGALAKAGLKPSDVELVLNTHGHLDHAGGNAAVKRATGARLHMHSADIPLAHSVEAEVEYHTAPLRVLGFPPEAVEARARFTAAMAGSDKVQVDQALADGEVIDLGRGLSLRVLHCPGHTPGHLAFYWESERVLLTGDAIQGQSIRPGSYPYYFDATAYRRSLAALAAVDCRILGLGHAYPGGGVISDPTRVGDEARLFLRDSIRVADTIHAAVADALRQRPGATYREIALASLAELIHHIPQLLVRGTQMPSHAGPTLLAHIRAAMEGTYPG